MEKKPYISKHSPFSPSSITYQPLHLTGYPYQFTCMSWIQYSVLGPLILFFLFSESECLSQLLSSLANSSLILQKSAHGQGLPWPTHPTCSPASVGPFLTVVRRWWIGWWIPWSHFSIPTVSHSALPCWKDAWMGGWVVELGNKGTYVLLLTVFYPLTWVEQSVGIGTIWLSRKFIMPFSLRLKSERKGINHSFTLQIKSSPSYFHSTHIYELLTMF